MQPLSFHIIQPTGSDHGSCIEDPDNLGTTFCNCTNDWIGDVCHIPCVDGDNVNGECVCSNNCTTGESCDSTCSGHGEWYLRTRQIYRLDISLYRLVLISHFFTDLYSHWTWFIVQEYRLVKVIFMKGVHEFWFPFYNGWFKMHLLTNLFLSKS